MRTNYVTEGDFRGESAYISVKSITIGLFKKAKTFPITDFEPLSSKFKEGTIAPLAIGAALGGWIGGLIGSTFCSKSEIYYRVKIRYGDNYKSIVILNDKQYNILSSFNKNTKKQPKINIIIE